MSEKFNVIALISGGKDSIYSIAHCLQNGHRVIALGNLYPPSVGTFSSETPDTDLNSYMYQTAGHNVIPLYEKIFGIPLYRQEIIGTAVHTGASYQPTADRVDETESLIPLLKTIMSVHPEANAVSTGAILSTYQRTRVESVALRLGLTPLSFLWKYPTLTPGNPASLLQDMANAEFDARIIKVASGGLDESFLWENVASEKAIRRVERAIARFGADGDGAVLGEGGEFETLVIDGPAPLFKACVVVPDHDRKIVREGGGAAWLQLQGAQVELKVHQLENVVNVRIPGLFDETFSALMEELSRIESGRETSTHALETIETSSEPFSTSADLSISVGDDLGQTWTLLSDNSSLPSSVVQETEDIISQLRALLNDARILISDVISTVIILRSMKDFANVNKIYGDFFSEVNPPSRVTIACGDVLPSNCNIIVHIQLCDDIILRPYKRSLHVQSRSYWAPANIGPYSQAQSIPLIPDDQSHDHMSKVYIAGQIPLIPATMSLPSNSAPEIQQNKSTLMGSDTFEFSIQVTLALQHLWRIGQCMRVCWWTAATAYLSRDSIDRIKTKSRMAAAAWYYLHHQGKGSNEDDEDEERDLWEERYHKGIDSKTGLAVTTHLPDWSHIDTHKVETYIPPYFAAEIEELPRASSIEWHGQLGITTGPVKVLRNVLASMGSIDMSIIDNKEAYSTIMIDYQSDLQRVDIVRAIEHFKDFANEEGIGKLGCNTGYHGSYLSYVDVSIKGLWMETNYGGSIPCRSLWDIEGKRLAVVLLCRSKMLG